MNVLIFLLLPLTFSAARADGQGASFALSVREAERAALSTSNLLKSYLADEDAAGEQADAQFQNLLPRLSFQGNYQYFANIPTIQSPLFGGAVVPFGTHQTYSVGPQLNYTLWDTFSARNSYQASNYLKQSRTEDRKNTELQLLSSLRSAYVQVQLGIEELRLINDSLDLAKAQDRDVMNRFHAGAADRLDMVTSKRSVLSYQIQFEQRQAQLSSSFKDLLNLIGDHTQRDVSHPGPPGVPGVTLALRLDSLKVLLAKGILPPSVSDPGSNQPQIRSQEFQAQSLELNAKSQKAKLFPVLQVSGGVSENLPDIPNPVTFLQETVAVSLTFPLFLGDPTSDLAAQQRRQSDAAQYRASQLKEDISRDFTKAREMLDSLRVQSELSLHDVTQSEEEARLYFTSYKAGKINFIDVQNANNQALQAKVNSARIDAQLLDQVITLISLSGEESPNANH